MPPMDLFPPDTTPQRLIDDAEGGVRYWPAVVDPPTAEAWFTALRDGVRWQSQQRPMYERVVDVPRLLAACRVDALPEHLPLAAMLAQVQMRAPAAYTGVGLNLYRDGQDSVAMHGDTLRTLAPVSRSPCCLWARRGACCCAKRPRAPRRARSISRRAACW